ncbi:MAG: hypothetical protein HY320_07945 [Armatimonadetes bacterium]|nr:hypothetical protein [Armatimonadota bacterium]
MRDWYSLERYSTDYARERQAEAARERLANQASSMVKQGRPNQPYAGRAKASALQRLLYRLGGHARARLIAWAREYGLSRYAARQRRLPSRHSA